MNLEQRSKVSRNRDPVTNLSYSDIVRIIFVLLKSYNQKRHTRSMLSDSNSALLILAYTCTQDTYKE